jgi:site-specific DNA recombinase
MHRLRGFGVQLVSVTEQVDDTPAGKLMVNMMGSWNQYHSDVSAYKALRGMTQKASVGGTPYMAPLGYKNVRELVNGYEVRTIAVDEEVAPLIRWVFDVYATGEYPLTRLLDELAERGLRLPPTKTRPERAVNRSSLGRMLRNRYYIGKVTFKGVEYEGRHPKLVDEEVFEQVQAMLDAKRAGEKQRIHHHYLKTTVYCGQCGARLCFSRNRGRGGTYDYFLCLGKQKRRSDCRLPYLPVAAVEDEIVALYESIVLTEDEATQLEAAIRAKLSRQRSQRERQAKQQRRRIARLEAERTKLLQAHYADAIPLELLRAEQQRITRELSNAEATLAACETELPAIEATLAKALALSTRCDRLYADGSNQDRRELNRFFFDRITVEAADNLSEGTLTEPIRPLLDREIARRLIEEEDGSEDSDPSSSGVGSRIDTLVLLVGFEPTLPGT